MRRARGVACRFALAAGFATAFYSGAARAEDSTDPLGSPVAIHGFVSQGFIVSTQNEYLAHSQRGSFELTEVGLNFTKQLTDELRVGVQLFAHDLGPIGNYRPDADWYYLDYRWRDWLGIRVGRVKMPFGLFSEVNDIDAARVPILLPQSIYPVDHREYLFAQTGGELYGALRLGPVGALEYRGYGGTLYADTPAPPAPGITVDDLRMPYVFGGRLLWSTPVPGLQLGLSGQKLRFDWNYELNPAVLAALQSVNVLPADLGTTLGVKFRVTRWVASLDYTLAGLELAAEYSRWVGEFLSRAPGLLPPHTVNERYYVLASYQVARWFTPGAYYSVYFPNIHVREGRGAYQYDWAATLRFDLNAHWLLKLESHLMHGTAALDNKQLNDGIEAKLLTKNWAAFLIKTTAYF